MSVNRKPSETSWVDPDDAPELTAEFFQQADEWHGPRLVRRGRPRLPQTKTLLSVRYSPEVVAYFRATGEGWQARMDAVLKAHVREQTESLSPDRD